MTTVTKSSLTVSAPGKLLLAGGYLVLESPNPGVVIGVNKRFYCSIETTRKDSSSSSTTEQQQQDPSSNDEKKVDTTADSRATKFIIPITVSSPQFDQEWKYEYHATAAPQVAPRLVANPTNASRNGFVEKTLRVSLLCLLNHAANNDITALHLTIRGDNDFYSLVPHLQAAQKPVNLANARQLAPFLPAAKGPDGAILKTGLGSSACLVTSLVAALVHTLYDNNDNEETETSDDNNKRDVIFRLAQICHCHAQGKVGSGFDVASACYGSHIYQRFPKEILADLLVQLDETEKGEDAATTTTTTSLQDKLRAKVFDTQWPGGLQAPLQLPSFLQVMLADVSGGSESPSMARTVLAWKKKIKEENSSDDDNDNNDTTTTTTIIPHWDDLAELNPKVGELWQQLLTVPAPTREELHHLATTPAREWKTNGVSDTPTTCRDVLYQLHQTLAQTRQHLRAMGEAAHVPIEPPEQTALANATSELPGVVAALVPGAGGYDALACVYIHMGNDDDEDTNSNNTAESVSVQQRIGTLWSEWGNDKKDPKDTTTTTTQVCPLTVQGISFGEGVRLESSPRDDE